MPELPEVETVKLQLQKYLTGHKIEDVQVRIPKLFTGDTKDVIGGKFVNVRRFAKVMSLDLSNGFSIVIHIKLTGQLIYRGPNLGQVPYLSKKIVGGVPGPHTHVIFKLDRGGFLYYNDIRRFGWIKIVESGKLKVETGFIGKLGPEPWINPNSPPDNVLTLELFSQIMAKTSRAVKVVLMDQAKMGGVGNIYATDALWLAKVNPKSPAKELQSDKVIELYEAIHTVLKAGLKYGGASELAFVTPDGAEGKYQDHTLAYGHEKEPCKRCKKGVITKYFLSGRGTYWCPICQK